MAYDLRTAMQRELTSLSTPSKRQVRNASGRAGRKSHNGQKALQKVGGYRNVMDAIYAPADKELCVVVPDSTGRKADGTPNRL